MDLQVGISSDA